jgi:hypothetical protein
MQYDKLEEVWISAPSPTVGHNLYVSILRPTTASYTTLDFLAIFDCRDDSATRRRAHARTTRLL